MSGAAHVDAGLQPERTALAWRRTSLALTVGPLLAARLLAPELGSWSSALAAAGVVVGLCLLLASRVRYRRTRTALTGSPVPDRGDGAAGAHLPGGRLLLVVAAVPTVGGLLVLVVVLAG